MSSPYQYRLRVEWSKDGKREKSVIPVFAFKGGAEKSVWPEEVQNLDTLKMITDMAYGARILTVCANFSDAYQALENREIDYFELHIKDTRYKSGPMEERRTVATITCRNMSASARSPVDSKVIKMSSEPKGNRLHAVSLSFFDYMGGPEFQKV